ncbi:hypothetical protein MAM1_0045c03136 [Mucor ambiguus]|uniref:Inner centromere protein ARK-binding domain-containing protein n=1 Tax=Mucor ambiguus TaxID=91626 RepID=A0A0C9M3R1_9FUNG|nr:hypothetical protein MAM1_0045c03136 [Mucor ambiguus]
MAKKTKKGYLWIFDQQDKWDEAASDKISQLEEAQAAHLDWFDRHSTVSELLALRRPNSKRRHDSISSATATATTTAAASQIVPNEDVVKESSELMDAESMDDKQTEDIVKLVGIQSIGTNKLAVDKVIVKRLMEDDPAHQTATPKVNAIENQPKNVPKTNTIVIPPSKVKPAAIMKAYTIPKAQPEKSKGRSFVDDYDEEDDQVQIVVSARKSNAAPKEKPPRPTVFPTRPEPQVSKSTPTKTISLTAHDRPFSSTTNASSYRSAFMNRLFKTSRPSLKKAALPSASLSTSSSTAATGNTATDATSPNNKRDSYSYHPTIITKRSSTASVRSISSSIHSTPIQASDIMPEPRFKRFKALQKLNQDPPAAAAEQVTHDLSTVEEVDESSKSQSQIIRENQQGLQESQQGSQENQQGPQENQQNQNESQSQTSLENAAAFVIPAWGEGDNLCNQLEKQASTDFYDFFGRFQSVDLKGKY